MNATHYTVGTSVCSYDGVEGHVAEVTERFVTVQYDDASRRSFTHTTFTTLHPYIRSRKAAAYAPGF